MIGKAWKRAGIWLSTSALFLGACADQLSGGIVSDDGELGLGEHGSEEDESQDDKSKQKDSDKDPSDDGDSGSDDDDSKSDSDSDGKSDTDSDDGSSTGQEEPTEQGSSSGSSSENDTDAMGTDDSSSDMSSEPPVDIEASEKLQISFSTRDYGGEFFPKNIGAVWVERADGTFLRTLKVWADRRSLHLVEWTEASKRDTTDAITGATLQDSQAHRLDWDLKDRSGETLGAGNYVLRFELTQDNSAGTAPKGPTFDVPIELGAPSQTIEVPDNDGFEMIRIVTPK